MIREVVVAWGIEHVPDARDSVIRGCNHPAHRDLVEHGAGFLFFALDVHQGRGAGDKRMVFRDRRVEEAKAFGFRLYGVLDGDGFAGFRVDVPRCGHWVGHRDGGVSLGCPDIGDVSRRVEEDIPTRAPLWDANIHRSGCIGCEGHRDRKLCGRRFSDGDGVCDGWHCRRARQMGTRKTKERYDNA